MLYSRNVLKMAKARGTKEKREETRGEKDDKTTGGQDNAPVSGTVKNQTSDDIVSETRLETDDEVVRWE
jgi:hypothetical protein